MKEQLQYTLVTKKATDYFPFLKKMKRDHFIFFLCLVIASLFWLLIKLSGVYTVTYVFNVDYNHEPVQKRMTSQVDSTLTVNVTARGFALVEMGFGNKHIPLSIDLRNYQLIHDKGTSYYIYTQELRESLATRLNVDEGNIVLSENRLGFVLEDLSSKRVPVVARYTIHYKEQFGPYMEARVVPDTVEVFGPASSIDTLSAVYTRKMVLNDVDSDIQVSLDLANNHREQFNYGVNKVTLNIDVERFTESSVVVPVNQDINSVTIKTFPSTVKIYYKVAQKDFNKIQPIQFNLVFDSKGVKLNEATKLHLLLDKQPQNISNVRLEPADVEFLIVK
jgi:hypothetical protein